jgi:hypothetical protein
VSKNEFARRVLQPDSLEAAGTTFGKTEFNALLFLLEHYKYTYQDILPHRHAKANTARVAISHKFTSLIRRLAGNQKNPFERNTFRALSKPAMNLFAYSPPELAFRFGGGSDGLTVGFSPMIASGLFASGSSLLQDARLDFYGNVNKGSKANLGIDGVGIRQWFPPFSLHAGGLVDLYCNAWWQVKYGASLGFGKDWMLNSTSPNKRWSSWTGQVTPVIVHVSALELVFLRITWGGQRSIDFQEKSLSYGKWDWTRLDGQIGLQLVW